METGGPEAVGALIVSIMILIIFLALYFLPTFIAFGRGKVNALSVLLLNIFLGWTLVGWVVSLVWAVKTDLIDKEIKDE